MRSVHSVTGLALFLAAAGWAAAQTSVLHIDASTFTDPSPSSFVGGAARSPAGDVLGLNSRYLTRNGKPWLPVMGEFHFTRVPRAQWEEEILKAKASGVNILATYVIWLHHEEVEGRFDWVGNRDLRAFTELCGKHGMYVYVRIGPWAHGEARNGGFPDWLSNEAPHNRMNDPAYLKYVALYYNQIGQQLRGELWKDGGPVVGIQLENEYARTGPGRGEDHILTLKRMATDAGLDVPYYSVTGWDGAVVPKAQTIAVFGGYPDQPWDGSLKDLPPQEVYAFRFGSRVTGNMGMLGTRAGSALGQNYDYPFITAEMGGGIQDTYHRRPVVSADDVAAMVPVMLGSGVNLYGSYMYQGGQNPEGKLSTLQESQSTGYPTDVPQKSYDFQAPLGEYGQERPTLRKLKVFNYFMNDFGPTLAPMESFAPAERPQGPGDLGVPRIAYRGKENQGFLFFNNYVRGGAMPARGGFQVALRLASGEVNVPRRPITLPSGAYGIWPVNMPLAGATLLYATAQPMLRLEIGASSRYYFVAEQSVSAEFSWEVSGGVIRSHSGKLEKTAAGIFVANVQPSFSEPAFTVTSGSTKSEIFLLSKQDAENLWRFQNPGGMHLVLTPDEFWAGESELHIDRRGDPSFSFAVSPAGTVHVHDATGMQVRSQTYASFVRAKLSAVSPQAAVSQVHDAGMVPAVQIGPAPSWRSGVAMVPSDDVFAEDSAKWTLTTSGIDWSKLKDVFLEVTYKGDIARLYAGGRLLDDDFYNGLTWDIGLRRYRKDLDQALSLSILPLRADAPIFLERGFRPQSASGQVMSLTRVTAVPQYELTFSLQ